ncbi:MAG: class I SAM-dependent methyltransferase [Candidatus Omnitrophica bacterium]|nr:class I SAM-dependent methyltransferase [Candidatus Omnitrophota bacterium]
MIEDKIISKGILNLVLNESVTILNGIPRDSTAFDVYLASYFRAHQKRYGKRDRTLIRTILFSHLRYTLRTEVWFHFLFPHIDVDTHTPLCMSLSLFFNKEITFQTLIAFCNESKLTFSTPRMTLLRTRKLPPSCRFKSLHEKLSLMHSFPEWLVKKWSHTFGKKLTTTLCAFLNHRAPLTIRANTLLVSRNDLKKRLITAGHTVRSCPLSPAGLFIDSDLSLYNTDEFKKGYFEIQDEGSQLIGYIINPSHFDYIWDVCAGSGGKTLHCAALMENKGNIIATDPRKSMIQELEKRIQRAGVTNVHRARLSTNINKQFKTLSADMIIIDAPCSGTGRLRRDPMLRWKLSPMSIKQHADKNIEILDRYARFLKQFGRLFYCTCSLEEEENEGVVKRFLETHRDFEAGSFTPHASFTQKITSHQFRIDPVLFKTDGFFVAVFEKIG